MHLRSIMACSPRRCARYSGSSRSTTARGRSGIEHRQVYRYARHRAARLDRARDVTVGRAARLFKLTPTWQPRAAHGSARRPDGRRHCATRSRARLPRTQRLPGAHQPDRRSGGEYGVLTLVQDETEDRVLGSGPHTRRGPGIHRSDSRWLEHARRVLRAAGPAGVVQGSSGGEGVERAGGVVWHESTVRRGERVPFQRVRARTQGSLGGPGARRGAAQTTRRAAPGHPG